jgi:O-antigen/teichoic acid export membrane protein
MWFTVKWRPVLVCNLRRIKVLFSYGWKLLVSGLIDTAYADLYSLVIGRKYNAGALAFYERGKQFPKFIINAINTTVQTVMLPAMSAEQSDRERVKSMMRTSIALSSYIIFPMMAGLAGVAIPVVRLLLTDKWLPCVPFLQISCFSMAFMPIHSCNLQAINAMGRSDIFLKLEMIKKIYGILLLTGAVVFFDSVLAIALVGIVSSLVSSVVNASPNKRLVGYSYWEQIRDIFPSMMLSFVMFVVVLLVEKIVVLPDVLLLCVQIVVGVVVYVGLSVVFGLQPFKQLLGLVKNLLKK